MLTAILFQSVYFFFAKEFFCQAGVEQDGLGVFEASAGACEHFQGEHIGGVGLHVIAGLVELSSVEGKEVLLVYGHDDVFEIAVGAEFPGQRHGLGRDGIGPFRIVGMGGDLRDGVVVGMIFIKG